jgi:hypothetical protein
MFGSLPMITFRSCGTRRTRLAANEANCLRAVSVNGVVRLPNGITVV